MAETPETLGRIGGFRLEEELARGGMGSVYRARQLSIDRQVALKVLAAKYTDDPVFRERFLKEARAAASLNHPNIVQAIDVGEDAGRFYFAMEFVEGRSLAALLKERGKIHPDEACSIVLQIGRALEHAARFGMLHLDVKPGNIMVSSAGLAKLADFGLARHVEDQDAIYAAKRVVFGTPHYMPPEQLRGGSAADSRCDIYALGVTFYELVTGVNPFSAPNSREVLNKVRAANVTPAATLEPSVPEDVSLVIAKMMAADANARYKSAAEMLIDLEALSRLRPPPIVRGLPLQMEEPVKSHRAALMAVIAASAALLVIVITVLIFEISRLNRNTEQIVAPPSTEDHSDGIVVPKGQESKLLEGVVTEAERFMAQEGYADALRLYDDFAKAHPGTTVGEEAQRAASGVRLRAVGHAEAIEKEAMDLLAKEDFTGASELADRIHGMGIADAEVVATRLRENIKKEEDAASRRGELAKREAAVEARQRCLTEANKLLADEKFTEAVKMCSDFAADPDNSYVRGEMQEQIGRMRALERAQTFVHQGADKSGKTTPARLADMKSEDIRALAEKGAPDGTPLRSSLAALFEFMGRPADAIIEIDKLQGQSQQPKWLVDVGSRALLAGASASLESGRAAEALARLRALNKQAAKQFLRKNEKEIAALLKRVADRLTEGMVVVPAGAFTYQKDTLATLPDFFIEKHEVTNAEYALFLKALQTAQDPAAWDHPLQPSSKHDHVPADWNNLKGNEQYPVVGVDWFDAYAYAAWRGRRLPTDKEWEKAARGSDARKYPWGQQWTLGACNAPPPVVQSTENLPKSVVAVGSFPSGNSPCGAEDMAGNAREWVYDEVASANDRVYVRGGSWSDPAIACATTYRIPLLRSARDNSTGFRCAADPVSLTQ